MVPRNTTETSIARTTGTGFIWPHAGWRFSSLCFGLPVNSLRFRLFLQLVLQCLPHLLQGGTTRRHLFFLLFYFLLSFDLFVFWVFRFLSFIECVCRACRIQYDHMALHCLLIYQVLCLLHTWYQIPGNNAICTRYSSITGDHS